MKNKKLQGKKNRAAGARFELKVRKDSENKGWIVDRWTNNVEFSHLCELPTRLIPAKSNRFGMRTTGFPDFIAFRRINPTNYIDKSYAMIGIECKSNGYLDKEEKEKCRWLLDNNIFSKILIAKKGKKRGEIEYNAL